MMLQPGHENSADRFLKMKTVAHLASLLNVGLDELVAMINEPAYREFSLQKKRGGIRTISAPCSALKTAQQKMNYYLNAVYLLQKPECVHGFVLNSPSLACCNILTNARPHTGKKFVLNMDIEDFFPSITAAMVLKLFRSNIFCFSDDVAIPLALLSTYRKMLPAGSPCSPVISNFICLPMDNELSAYCANNIITYTRYADDLTFSFDNKPEKNVVIELRAIIENHHLKLNSRKFRIQSNLRQQTVTGLVVNRGVNVDREYVRRLRAIIHDLRTNKLPVVVQRHFGLKLYPASPVIQYFYHKITGQINFVGFVKGKNNPVYLRLQHGFTEAIRMHTEKGCDGLTSID